MDIFLTITIIAVVIGFVRAISEAIETSNKQKNKQKEFGRFIENLPDFTATYEYLGADGNSGIAIDEPQSKVCILSRVGTVLTHRIMDYKDIFSSELFEDGETITKTVRSSQVIGTAVGGLLLGGVGAVIGGLSGEKAGKGMIERIELRLVVNDSVNPVHDICFLNVKNNRDGILYKVASDVARQWQARLDVLIKRADKEVWMVKSAASAEQQQSNAAIVGGWSVGDELKKLADLKAQGILSDEEFACQKAKLLG